MKELYQMDAKEVIEQLDTTDKGLTVQESERRLQEHGPNVLCEEKVRPLWKVFLQQFQDALVVILMAAAIISGILGDWESACVILLVLGLNAVLGTFQHAKAEQSMAGLRKMAAPHAKVLRDGELREIPSQEVVPGDYLVVEAGDLVAADVRILEQASLQVAESALTGESLPVEKQNECLEGELPLGDRVNMLYSGSYVTHGRGGGIVTATGMDTEMGKIAGLLADTKAHRTPLQESLDQFGKRISMLILAVCAVLLVLSLVRGMALMDAFLFAVALAVAAIPEALSSIVTIVLAFGTQKMAQEHAIIRKLQAVEGLGSVSVICTDKTGTLTQNRMTVTQIYVEGHSKKVEETLLLRKVEHMLVTASVLCNDGVQTQGETLGDPTETAFLTMLDQLEGAPSYQELREKYPRIGEIPFDSVRKMMSTVHSIEKNKKVVMVTKGAVDVILQQADEVHLSDGLRPLNAADRQNILEVNEKYASEGLRVLAFGYRLMDAEHWSVLESHSTQEDPEEHLIFLGLYAMMDPPRPESAEAVTACIQAGIRPVMITGDHPVTAGAIAREIGILQPGQKVVGGMELEHLSKEELKELVPNVAVYARVSPEHKIRIVEAWQELGHMVAMTGDGVNDAPALKQANVGVAMGITGTEVSKEAASMVLTDDNFATIVKAVENGRNVYANIQKAIHYLLSGNTAAILAVLFTFLADLPVPFAPVQLLFINLLTDSLPAIALGLDPHTHQVMELPPRDPKTSMLSGRMLGRMGIQGLLLSVATVGAYLLGYQAGGGATASTMAFGCLCLSRLLHGFHCQAKRDKKKALSSWGSGLFRNPLLWFAFGIGGILLHLVLLVPALQGVFAVTPLSGELWLELYGLAAFGFILVHLWQLGSRAFSAASSRRDK